MADFLSFPDRTLFVWADAFIKAHWDAILRDIERLVSVPSVVDYSAATEQDPFGPAAHEGLKTALAIASDLGFSVTDDHGYIGWADLPGSSDTQLAMICHADVVSPNIGWTVNPWGLTRRDGFLLGRGVLDDKGPLVVSLYVMKFFADMASQSGKPLPYTLRMLIGSSEEVGMEDAHYYLQHHEAPAFLFTPDAEFPVCYGEKGQFNVTLRFTGTENGRIVRFTTGDGATNAVPGRAVMTVRVNAADLLEPDGIQIDDASAELGAETGTFAQITATGRGGHASLPEGTRNAIGMCAHYALDHGLANPDEASFLRMACRITDSYDGSGFGIACSDDHFGALTTVAGTIHMVEGRLQLTVDTRYPTAIDADQLRSAFETLAASGNAQVVETDGKKPFLMDPNGAIIDALIGAYRDASGLDGEPFTMGGGTYARLFPCAASYGPFDFNDKLPDWVGPMHGADEGISEAALKRAMRVYILAVKRLLTLDLAHLEG